MRLSQLPRNTSAIVECVEDSQSDDSIAQRLRDLGFVSGEAVCIVAQGPWGGDPILVLVGSTRFALRRAEAGRVVVQEVTGQ